MEQNNLEQQTINKLNALNKALGITNQLTQIVIHPKSNETNIKFLMTSEDKASGAEFICNVEDTLQIQALLAKLIEKTKQIRFYEL